jgi:arylsulfatase A-like enzyme
VVGFRLGAIVTAALLCTPILDRSIQARRKEQVVSNLAEKHSRGAASEAQSISQSSPALSRREFLKGAFVSGASAIVADMGFSRGSSLGTGSDAGAGKDRRGNLASTTHPNIVYVFSDQHRNCSWPGGGTAQIQTPNLERLATQGVVLTNCISNYPLCSPHRASLLTGRFPQAHTIERNVLPMDDPLPTTEPSIARALRNEGYATGYVGKWHLYPGDISGTLVPPGDHRHGFDDYWRACHNLRCRYDTRTYDDEGVEIVLTDYAPKSQMDMVKGFIQEHASEPFCIFLSWQPPHPPFTEAPSRFEDLYPLDQIQVRPNVPENLVTPALLEDHRGYYAHISALDEQIGRLMDKLDELGIADNTIVVYSSDHGEMLGSLGHPSKNHPWEESINVPFVIRWPAGIPANGRLDTLFSSVDVTPTLLSLAGVPVPAQMQGLDLSHVLKGQTGSVPDSALIMSINPGVLPVRHNMGDWRGVRTLDYTYARRVEEAGVTPWILYDNQNDPFQMTNLLNDPGCSDIQAELDAVLSDWLIRVTPHRVHMPMVCKTVGQSTATSLDGSK